MRRVIIITCFFFIIVLLTGCISIPIGDGDKLKLSGDGVTIESKEGEKTSISADGEDGSFSIEGTDSDGEETNINISTSKEIPKEFPSDIPVPKKAEIFSTSDSIIDGSKMMQVNYGIEGNVEDVMKYGDLYREYFEEAGYEKQLDSDYGDHIQLSASKDEKTSIQAMIIGSDDDSSIDVMITYMISAED